LQEEIARSAYEHQLRVESGATTVVGVNKFTDDEPPPPIPAPDYSRLEQDQVKSLGEVKRKRDDQSVSRCLAALSSGAASLVAKNGGSHMMPLVIEAVRARCTIGEISDTLQSRWGAYSPAT